MMKRLIPAAALLVALIISPITSGSLLELKVRYWRPEFDADVTVNEDEVIGTTVDIDKDLGIETEEGITPIELDLSLGSRFNLWFIYTDMLFEGSASVEDEFVFSGETFFVDADIESRIELTSGEIGAELDLLPTDMFGLGPCVSGTFFDGQASVTETNAMITAEGSLTTFVSTFGGFARLSLLDGSIQLYGRYMKSALGDDTYTDITIEAKYEIFGNVGIIGGYREIEVDVEDNDVFFDGGLSGFFIGGVVSF